MVFDCIVFLFTSEVGIPPAVTIWRPGVLFVNEISRFLIFSIHRLIDFLLVSASV